MFFSPFSIATTSLWEERANLSTSRTFVRFALVWFCLFPLPLGAWEGLRFVIVALPGLFLPFFFFFFFFPIHNRIRLTLFTIPYVILVIHSRQNNGLVQCHILCSPNRNLVK